MKRIVVRYKTKPEQASENARLIEQVFRELRAKAPDGVRYLALRLADGTFVHFVEADDGPSLIPQLEAFQSFQKGIKERCIELPQSSEATVVGLLVNGALVPAAGAGTEVEVVLDRTPFYAEGGGQLADTGIIKTANKGKRGAADQSDDEAGGVIIVKISKILVG